MHRLKSLEPFTRHFSGQKFMDMLELLDQGPNTTITVKPDSVDVLAPVLASYKNAQEGGRILYVTFTTVADYFWLLRAACECLAVFETKAVLFLAAAVSDFYVPSNEMVRCRGECALKFDLEIAAHSQDPIRGRRPHDPVATSTEIAGAAGQLVGAPRLYSLIQTRN
jgi:hypothetical protein